MNPLDKGIVIMPDESESIYNDSYFETLAYLYNYSCEFTNEEKIRFCVLLEKWINIALSTDPSDRNTAEKAISELYTEAGYSPPNHILWLKNPLEIAIARKLIDLYTLLLEHPNQLNFSGNLPYIFSVVQQKNRLRYQEIPFYDTLAYIENNLILFFAQNKCTTEWKETWKHIALPTIEFDQIFYNVIETNYKKWEYFKLKSRSIRDFSLWDTELIVKEEIVRNLNLWDYFSFQYIFPNNYEINQINQILANDHLEDSIRFSLNYLKELSSGRLISHKESISNSFHISNKFSSSWDLLAQEFFLPSKRSIIPATNLLNNCCYFEFYHNAALLCPNPLELKISYKQLYCSDGPAISFPGDLHVYKNHYF